MYKFVIMLISCVLGANNPIQDASTIDEVLESTFQEYQNYLKIGDKDLELKQFLEFLGNDVESRAALFSYYHMEDIETLQRYIINVDRFKTFFKVVAITLEKNIIKFAEECLIKATSPETTNKVTDECQ